MFPNYTAIELIRVMNEELAERHRRTAFAQQWEGATTDRSPVRSLKGLVRRGRS